MNSQSIYQKPIEKHSIITHISNLLLDDINNEIKSNPTAPKLVFTLSNILGSNTAEYINTYLTYILFKQGINFGKNPLNELTKLTNKLTNIKVIIDIETKKINVSIDNLIYTYDGNTKILSDNLKYKKLLRYYRSIDVSFDEQLTNKNDEIIDLINHKIDLNIKDINEQQIENIYIKFLTNILTKL